MDYEPVCLTFEKELSQLLCLSHDSIQSAKEFTGLVRPSLLCFPGGGADMEEIETRKGSLSCLSIYFECVCICVATHV